MPFPPRSVFNAGGISSITSIFFSFSKYRSDKVKERMNALVAQYTGTLLSGANARPDVTLMIVVNEEKFRNKLVRCTGASTLIAISFFVFWKKSLSESDI